MTQYTDEQAFDLVVKALMSGSKTLGEIHEKLNFVANTDQVDEALDILDDVDVLNSRQEPRGHGKEDKRKLTLRQVYEIKSECKTKNIMKEYREKLAAIHSD
jgi:hypothetical protein